MEFTRFTAPTTVDFTSTPASSVTEPTTVRIDGGAPVPLAPGPHTAADGARWEFPAGAAVPRIDGAAVPGSATWQRPLLDAGSAGHPLLATWSVLMATALGTMGLPHVLVRFHTSPDGRGARRTAAITVALLGAFYLFPGVYGLLGAVLLPQLYLSGRHRHRRRRAAVARSTRARPGDLFTALLTAGAFAAFLATSLGMLLAVSGAVSHDLVPARPAPAAVHPAGRRGRRRAARAARGAGRRRRAGHLGVRGRGVDLLPAARARHLVARADGARARWWGWSSAWWARPA